MSFDCTVIVGTFGEEHWRELAQERAIPSAEQQAPVIHVHGDVEATYGASLAHARNQGAEQADSEWLCFLDADDELMPGFVDAMERATGDLRTPAVSYVRPGERGPAKPMFWPEKDLRDSNFLILSTLIRRNEFFDVGAFRDWPLYEDWDLWHRCWKTGAAIERVPDAVVRVHINTASKHRRGSSSAEKREAHEMIRRANFPELYEAAA